MFIPRKLLRVIKLALGCGAQVCLVVSICLVVLILYDPNISSISIEQSRPSYVEPLSRIELIKRELLNERRGVFDDQDFVSKTSEIAHRVFEIKPQIRRTNETDLYPFDVTQPSPEIKLNSKFLFVLHHYEQLGKATENLVQLCAIANEMGRTVVQPYVRDSRMCGVPGGWYGELRRKSRLFRPFDVYYDVQHFNQLMTKSNYATLTKLSVFKDVCANEGTTFVHFIYAGPDAEESLRKWYNITSEQYNKIMSAIQPQGYCECNFIDRGLNISNRIGKIKAGRQLCVDPEIIRDIAVLENNVLQNDRCVVVVHWRGIGRNRTHFRPKVTIKPWEIVTSLAHSNLIRSEVSRYKEVSFLDNNPYIAVHVRSERQLHWYGADKLKRCLSVLIELVKKLKKRHKIKHVFVATDLSVYGSDTFALPSAQTDTTLRSKLAAIQQDLLDRLKPLFFTPHGKRNSVLYDKGVVAITEMNLLFGGSHLVTLGSGTFQQWIMDVFVKNHSNDEHQTWTITRVCSREERKSKHNHGIEI